MEDQITSPVSMVGAGIIPPQQPPVDIGGIIGSMPSMPAMAPPPQANPGLAAFSGLQAGMAGQGAVNPYLAQQQQASNQMMDQSIRTGYLGLNIQEAQARQAFQQQELQARLQQMKQQAMYRRQEMTFKLSDDMLKSMDDTTRIAGAKARVDLAGELGINLDPAIVQGMAQKQYTQEDLSKAARYLAMPNMDPQTVSAMTGIPARVLLPLTDPKNQSSDAFSQVVYGKSLAQRQLESVNLSKSSYEEWSAKHPEVKTPAGAEASLIAASKFGTTMDNLSDEDRVSALRAGQDVLKQREIADEQRKLQNQKDLENYKAELKIQGKDTSVAQFVGQHPVKLLDKNGNEYSGSPLVPISVPLSSGFDIVRSDEAKQIQGSRYAFGILANMRAQAAKLAQNGKLAIAAQAFDQAYQQTIAQNPALWDAVKADQPGAWDRFKGGMNLQMMRLTKDADVLQWFGMESEMIIALRSMGEVGVRAIGAFEGAMNVMKTGQYQAIDGYLRNLETSAQGQLDPKWRGALSTTYVARDKETNKVGELKLAPGEALDLSKYQILPKFSLPASVRNSPAPQKQEAPATAGPLSINRGQPNFYFPKGTPERLKLDTLAGGDFDQLSQAEKEKVFNAAFPGHLGKK